MGMHKDIVFDKEYCRVLNQCMNQARYGAITFIVDMHMSEFTIKSCMNSEAITTNVVLEDYFKQFNFSNLMDIELGLEDDEDDDDE